MHEICHLSELGVTISVLKEATAKQSEVSKYFSIRPFPSLTRLLGKAWPNLGIENPSVFQSASNLLILISSVSMEAFRGSS